MPFLLSPGTRLGRYEIRAHIGAGGMGEVYLAQDMELDRKVAIKILPAGVAADEKRMQRFVQEAKAASGLNHPNILTVYEIGRSDSVHFIATEYIEGETLRNRLSSSTLGLNEVLDFSVQVANALATAHAAGIIHRDIKPQNVMIRRDAIVKVVDFGLAKLTSPDSAEVDTQAVTKNLFKSDPGTVVGTAVYMSPEQARGIPVDARTDIFSLGIMIYEMTAGRLPFDGSTSSAILAAILSEKSPQPLARYSREVPAELERIVSKALRKNRDERYQTVKDMLLDLKALKQELEFTAKLEQSGSPASGAERASDLERAAVATSSLGPKHTTSERETIGGIKGHKRTLAVALGILLLAMLGITYWRYTRGVSNAAPIASLAVIPFQNASGDQETEYISDGLSENLINKLSQLPQLKVIARSSSFRYKGKDIDPQEVGHTLGVEALVMGRVAQRGDNLLVSVELVNASDKRQIWGTQYNRKVSDLQAVQEDIAQAVSENLRLRLTGEEQKSLTKRYTNNTEAYQLYLKCNFYWNKFTPEGERTAIDYCTQAIVLDPNFALPYGGLAHSYQVSANNGWMRPHDAYPKAKAAVAKGLALAPNNAALLNAAAATAMFYDWDWTTAESEFKGALKIEPNYWHLHELYSYLLTAQGRTEEAVAEARRAQEIDPMSLIAHTSAAHPFYFSRQYDRSLEQVRKALELDSKFPTAHVKVARNFVQQGKYEDAIAEYKLAISLVGRTSQNLGELGNVYAVSGNRAEALKLLDELQEMSARQYVSPLDFAFIHTGLGDREQALAYLEKAYDERSTWLMWIKVDPRFDSLRSEPRFQDLQRRMGL
jgi:serine/threonine protein kinase/Flp pilus assembly protein TadD